MKNDRGAEIAELIRESEECIQRLIELRNKENDEVPDFKSKGEPFWRTDCPDDIFEAHPASAEALLYKKK